VQALRGPAYFADRVHKLSIRDVLAVSLQTFNLQKLVSTLFNHGAYFCSRSEEPSKTALA